MGESYVTTDNPKFYIKDEYGWVPNPDYMGVNNPKFNTEDNGFTIAVFIDGIDKNVLELSQEQMLHIGAILLNASRKFINNANKTNS